MLVTLLRDSTYMLHEGERRGRGPVCSINTAVKSIGMSRNFSLPPSLSLSVYLNRLGKTISTTQIKYMNSGVPVIIGLFSLPLASNQDPRRRPSYKMMIASAHC